MSRPQRTSRSTECYPQRRERMLPNPRFVKNLLCESSGVSASARLTPVVDDRAKLVVLH
jgi:hypothetical protein